MDTTLSFVRQRIARDGPMLFGGHAFTAIAARTRGRLLRRRLGSANALVGAGALIKGVRYMTVGNNFSAGRGLWLEAIDAYREQAFFPRIAIGRNVSLSSWCHIAAIASVTIGDDVMIGSSVAIIDHNHGRYGAGVQDIPGTPPAERELSAGAVMIGSNVWIGDGVVITRNSTIGSGSIIGANAVVSGELAPNTMFVGIPARAVKVFDAASQRWVPVR